MKLMTVVGSLVRRLPRKQAAASAFVDNATEVLPMTVSVSADTATRTRQLCQVAASLCPFLLDEADRSLDSPGTFDSCPSLLTDRLKVTPLIGGLSNELFIVENKFRKTARVLVRIYPDSSEGDIIDRGTENRLVSWLSARGQAPTFYGRFANGRVEEFYNDYVPLSWRDMARYGPEIAANLGRLHNLKVPEGLLKPAANGVWDMVDRWFELLLHNGAPTPEESSSDDDSEAFTTAGVCVYELRREWNWLRNALIQRNEVGTDNLGVVDFCNDIVLSHMDLQSLNLLRPANRDVPGEGNLKVIDFEYSGLNPRAVDIANTFCEHCSMNNLKADYEKEYPSAKAQDAFLRSYLESLDHSPMQGLNDKQQARFLAEMRQELGRWTLVSHLGWSVWARVQSRQSSIDYDYEAYARQRMRGYYYFKQQHWSYL